MNASGLKFTKMSAGGNDFIVLDNITLGDDPVTPDAEFIRRICSRALSVGADGLILLEPSRTAQVKMVYFNADGGRASLCGNGVRCVARMAAVRRWAEPEAMTIETDVGVLDAGIVDEGVRFALPLGTPAIEVRTLLLEGSLDEISREIRATHVVAGVPHLVVEHRDAHAMPRDRFLGIATRLRSHPDLGAEGANVDYITIRDRERIDIRCFERGVESETLSSGSGCIAAALAVIQAGRAESPVTCMSRAGFRSVVRIDRGPDGAVVATLTGDARIIYTATLNAEAIEGFDP